MFIYVFMLCGLGVQLIFLLFWLKSTEFVVTLGKYEADFLLDSVLTRQIMAEYTRQIISNIYQLHMHRLLGRSKHFKF